jgi:hypothetical protein
LAIKEGERSIYQENRKRRKKAKNDNFKRELTSSLAVVICFLAILIPLLALFFLLFFLGGAWGPTRCSFDFGDSTVCSYRLFIFVVVRITSYRVLIPSSTWDFGVSSSSL